MADQELHSFLEARKNQARSMLATAPLKKSTALAADRDTLETINVPPVLAALIKSLLEKYGPTAMAALIAWLESILPAPAPSGS